MVGISSEKIHSSILKAGKSRGKGLNKIASGEKIITGSDDPAGLSVLMSVESQTRGLMQQIGNRQDEISLIQTAESALGNTSNILQRMNELSIQASNGAISDSDRKLLQIELDQLNQQINQTVNNTKYNTKPLIDGSLNIELQNGENLTIPSMNSEEIGVSNIDLTTLSGAQNAITNTANAISAVVSQRNTLGALSNGISSDISNLRAQMISSLEAQSRIGDADLAQEVINLSLNELQSKVAIQAFKMDNETRATVLNLLD